MSKKEEQRRRREEKRQAAQRREKLQRGAIWAAVVVLVPLALYVLVYQGLFGGGQVLPPDQVSQSDHVKGDPDAPVTLTVYADFQCPACAMETQLIDRAWPRINDKVQLVFRHFPLDTHPHAFLAARYAEAAARQNRFWEMHDLLFANQASWSRMDNPREAFNSYAEQAGLDLQQLQADLESGEVRDKIVADQQGGLRAGVRGTPALFLNGRLINNPSTAGRLVELVNEAQADSDA